MADARWDLRRQSDGQWAKTRDVYHDEATITSTWTISSTCTTHVDCTGTVTSDQGWSAGAHYNGGLWFVEHDLPAGSRAATGRRHLVSSSSVSTASTPRP